MCWRCDNPDATDEDYLDLIRSVIDSQGWFVQGVEKGRWQPGFTYTVGLMQVGHAELLVTGMAHRASVELLNRIAHQVVHHDAPAVIHGDRHVWLDGTVIEVVDVAEPTVHLVMAHGLYGRRHPRRATRLHR